MSAGVLYANSNIIMQGDAYLLTRKRIREMAAADTRDDILKILAECNYRTDLADDAALLATERAKTLDTFTQLCEDPALVACVQAWDGVTETTIKDAFATIAAHGPQIKSKSIREYFVTLADLVNARTVAKGGHDLVAGGSMDATTLRTQNLADLQQRLDQIALTDKDDIFKPNPLFWWYLQKQKELVVVKTILLYKRCHYDATLLRENLRGLYEQFK